MKRNVLGRAWRTRVLKKLLLQETKVNMSIKLANEHPFFDVFVLVIFLYMQFTGVFFILFFDSAQSESTEHIVAMERSRAEQRTKLRTAYYECRE